MIATLPRCPALCLVVLLAACSSGEDAAEETAQAGPAPTMTSNPVMTAAPDGSPITPGTWEIGEDARNAHARFGPPGSEPVLAMECDVASQRLTLTRAGDAGAQAGGEQTYILEASGMKASLDMAPATSGLPMLEAEINRAMPIFQAFEPVDSVITVTGPDGDVLRVQGAPGISRVIEACSRT